MFKKRNVKRPTRKREAEDARDEGEELTKDTSSHDEAEGVEDEDDKLAIEELRALRKLRKARQGIDTTKLIEGDTKKKKKRQTEEEEGGQQYGLQIPKAEIDVPDDDNDLDENKARKLVRANNFTQQTNKLDVDKHMMAYIEENMKKLRGESHNSGDKQEDEPYDPHAELYKIDEKYQIKKKVVEEGNVTNSLAMLTAIPEVDLGMETRLKNIEETEKAKRQVQDEKKNRRHQARDETEAYLSSTRFFRPHQAVPSDEDTLKNARREAMGLAPEAERRTHSDRKDTATDEAVMERFKKRMRR